MATTVARLESVLSADTRDFDRAMDRSQKKTTSFGGHLASLGKTAGLAAGAAGIGGIALVLKAGIGEYMQSQKVTAQTAAVIKSTGGIARVTTKHVQDLSTALMKKSGVDDEVIQSGANMLLTFKNIRNEVGKGNDIFDQSNKVLTDMTVALGTDPQKQAIQLGKALNDPVAGISALARVGVTFTDGQKKVIKGLVDTGHTAAAQKIILKELNSEFGGSAEAAGKTLPGMIAIARQSFNNWAGDLVTKMIPVLQQIVAWVREHWPEISAAFQQAWANIKPTLVALGQLVVSIVTLIKNHWGTIGPIVMQAVKVIQSTLKVITDIIKLFAAILRGDWSEAWRQVKNIVFDTLDLIKQRLILLKDVFLALVKGIGGAIVDGLQAGISAGLKELKDAVTGLFDKVIGWAKDALGIKSPSSVFHDIGQNAIKGFINGVGSMSGLLKKAVVKIATSIPNPFGGLFDRVKKVVPGASGSTLGTLVPWAQSEGMTISSTTGGQHVKGSYHYQGRAIDVVGSASAMKRFFFDSLEHFGLQIKELFYDPVGEYVKNGSIIRGSIGGHSDHVHLALDKGGWLPTGTNLITNNTGRPERVLGPGEGGTVVFNFPNYIGSKQALMSYLRQAASQYSSRNGRPAFGGA